MKKRNMGRNLAHYWYWYVLAIAIPSLVWHLVFLGITAPRKEEKLVFFAGAYGFEGSALHDALQAKKPQGIKRLDVYSYRIQDYTFAEMFTIHGGREADLFLLPESKVAQYHDYFLPIQDEDYLRQYVENPVYRVFEGDRFPLGVLAYDHESRRGVLADFVHYEPMEGEGENYYLLFRKASTHVGTLGEKGKDDAALRFFGSVMKA